MPNLITAEAVKTRLFTIRGIPVERRPSGLTDAVVDEYVRRCSAEVLARLGQTDAAPSGTQKRDAVDGVCLDLVLIAIRRDFFGLDGATMQALNTQEGNAWKRLDELVETPVADTSSVKIRISGARGP